MDWKDRALACPFGRCRGCLDRFGADGSKQKPVKCARCTFVLCARCASVDFAPGRRNAPHCAGCHRKPVAFAAHRARRFGVLIVASLSDALPWDLVLLVIKAYGSSGTPDPAWEACESFPQIRTVDVRDPSSGSASGSNVNDLWWNVRANRLWFRWPEKSWVTLTDRNTEAGGHTVPQIGVASIGVRRVPSRGKPRFRAVSQQ